MTSARTASERAAARARNLAHLELNRQEESKAVPIGQLWRQAGGGTSGFSPAAFTGLLTSEHWTAADRCDFSACGVSPPHLCWWSAIRAAVIEARARKAKPSDRPHSTTFDQSAGNALLF